MRVLKKLLFTAKTLSYLFYYVQLSISHIYSNEIIIDTANNRHLSTYLRNSPCLGYKPVIFGLQTPWSLAQTPVLLYTFQYLFLYIIFYFCFAFHI
jgi:hypothetical protein